MVVFHTTISTQPFLHAEFVSIRFRLTIVSENALKSKHGMLPGMRLLGIDYGSKRVGIALTDDKAMMAFPHSVLQNTPTLQKEIERIVAQESVGKIVIGYSLNREGQPNKVHDAVETLMLDLTLSTGIPIELEPEQYTTQEAIRLQGKNEKTDASAAAIILNSYLTRHKSKKHD